MPTGPDSAVPTTAMQSSSSSSSASSSSSSSSSSVGDEEQQDEGSQLNRRRLRQIRLRQAVQLSQPSPASAPSASSPVTHARARARARMRARTSRATSWAHSISSQRGGTRAERWQSQGPQQTEAIAAPTGGSREEETPEGGSNSPAAGSGVRAGVGRFLTPFSSFPRSRNFRASGDSGVTAPETGAGAGSGGGVMDIRWVSETDGAGASGRNTNARAVGRGYGNHLQVGCSSHLFGLCSVSCRWVASSSIAAGTFSCGA